MVSVKKEGVLLYKSDLVFENEGVLNPGVIQAGSDVHIYYRAVSKGNYSSIGYCKLDGPLTVVQRNESPLISPEFEYESHGIEDPRIVKIDDLLYLTYTAYDGVNALSALASAENYLNFEKKGIITPQISFEDFKSLAETKEKIDQKYIEYNQHIVTRERDGDAVLLWDKNFIFFPRKINGKFYFLHRIKPDVQIASIDKIENLTEEFWKEYFLLLDDNILMRSKYKHESAYLGGGCPPIETESGWLLIYHGVEQTKNGNVYSACASMLDLNNPEKEIARLPYPLFVPQESYEVEGEVNNVCFPTGTSQFGETLYIYYGAADEQIATASLNLNELINELMKNRI